MDLRPYKPTKQQIIEAQKYLDYQPFILSDTVQTGVGYGFLYGEGKPFMIEKDKATKEEWKNFTDANGRMRKMYDDWVDATCAVVGNIKGLTIAEMGCNTGYFLYRFMEKGAAKAFGFDRNDLTPAFNILNNITGYNVKFKQNSYDLLTHTAKGVKKYDIVISSAVICHLSDPLNYINFLASTTKKVLLVHTRISDENEYVITLGEANRYYKDDPFPICFDNNTTISKGLFLESMRLTGFNRVQEIEYRDDWLPMNWYHWHKTYVAVRDNKPIVLSTPKNQYKWGWLVRIIRSVIGQKRLESLTGFVKSIPILKSFAKRLGF